VKSSVAKIGKYHLLPNLEISSVARIGKYRQLPNLPNFVDIKVAKIGRECPNLVNSGHHSKTCQQGYLLGFN